MFDFLLQLSGLLLLCGGLAFAYWRWVRPHAASTGVQGQGLLLLVALTLMGGFIGSPFWWADEARSFSWDLPPLASRMLAAAGWSFVAICYLALRRPTRLRLRLVLILLFVYLTPLLLAILLFDLDRFDFAAPITYAFFAIVLIMVAASSWYLLRQPAVVPEEPRDSVRPRPPVRAWMAVVAIVTGLWGLALFATDAGPSPLLWAWPGDLLSSRLIGVMLLAIAAGSIYGRRYVDTARVMLAMIVTYAAGLAAASLWNALVGRPVPYLYLAVFGVIALVSVVLLAADGAGSGPDGSKPTL